MRIWPKLRSLWQHLFSPVTDETPIQPIAIVGQAESSPTYSGKAAPSQFKNLQGDPRPTHMDVCFKWAISRLRCHLANQTPSASRRSRSTNGCSSPVVSPSLVQLRARVFRRLEIDLARARRRSKVAVATSVMAPIIVAAWRGIPHFGILSQRAM